MTNKFRVQDKGNVNMNGKKTSFKLFERKPGSDVFVFAGHFFAPGYNRTDEQCIDSAIGQLESDAESAQ